MAEYDATIVSGQTIELPLRVGADVTLFDADGNAFFLDTVAQYNPRTLLLTFEDTDVGRARFLQLVDNAAGYKVING